MKVSVVTVCLNSAATIEDTIKSVLAQTGIEVQFIIVDGGSTDGTLEIVDRYRDRIDHIETGPDTGLYNAMNKGLAHATGDLVGFLNSDDYFADESSLFDLVKRVEVDGSDCVFADVAMVDRHGSVVRIYSGKGFHPSRLEKAYATPHPSFYAKTALVRDVGGFDEAYKVAGDFHLMIKLLGIRQASWSYLPRITTFMRLGGVSTSGLKSYRVCTDENIRALRSCGLRPDLLAIHGRFFRKFGEIGRTFLTNRSMRSTGFGQAH